MAQPPGRVSFNDPKNGARRNAFLISLRFDQDYVTFGLAEAICCVNIGVIQTAQGKQYFLFTKTLFVEEV